MKNLYAALWLGIAGLMLAACGGPTNKEKQVIAEMTKDMRTDCVGRLLIDVPQTFSWTAVPMVTLYYGKGADFSTVDVQIMGQKEAVETFKARVDQRAEEIKINVNGQSKKSMLLSDVEKSESVRIIKRYKDKNISRAYTYEVYFLVSGVMIFLKGNSFPEDGDTVLPRLERLTSQFRKPEGPSSQWGPGFCLGPVLINADNDYEVMSISASDDSGKYRDVSLELYMSDVERSEKNSETLSDRTDMAGQALGGAMKVLRKRKIQIMGSSGEESLVRFAELENRHSLSFGAWLMQANPSRAQPSLTLGLDTGGQLPEGAASTDASQSEEVNSSLSDEEAMGLWDTVIKSIRPRPGAAAVN